MAEIPRKALDALTREVNGISEDAQARVLKVLEAIEWAPGTIAECRDIVVKAVHDVCEFYSGVSAQAAAEFYDAVRLFSIDEELGAIASSGYIPIATERAVRAMVQDIVDGKPVSGFNGKVLSRIDFEMKRAAGNTIFENGSRDPRRPRFARVPSGGETCDFCLMLASRGFVYKSAKTAGSDEHYHANCDCRIVPGWDVDSAGPSRGVSFSTTVEGYDPDSLYDYYLDNLAGKKWHGGGVRPSGAKAPDGAVFKKYTDFTEYLEKSANIEDLFERSKTVALALADWMPDEKRRKSYFDSIRIHGINLLGRLRVEEGGVAVGAMKRTALRSSNVILTKGQFGKKVRKHAKDWGLDPSITEDRKTLEEIIAGIIDNADAIDAGDWRDQKNPCTFYRCGNDLVIVNADDEFATIMRGGGTNKRYRNAIGREGNQVQRDR